MEREQEGPLPDGRKPAMPWDGWLAPLTEDATVRRLSRGEVLFEEGAAADLLFVLVDGAIVLSSGDGPRTRLIELVQPVECLGLEAVLADRPQPVAARALEPSHVVQVSAEEVRRRVTAEPELAQVLLDRLVAHGLRLTVQIKELKQHGTIERLGCWLLRSVDEGRNQDWARLAVPKGTLAQLLGMTAESLSRAFAALRLHGVEVRGSRVRILDRARLAAFCRCGAAGG